MGSARLYAELGVDFRPDSQDMALQELAHVAQNYQALLGPESSGEPQTEARGTRLKQLAFELHQERVQFVPAPEVMALRPDLFNHLKLQAPAYLDQLFHRFNFYLVNFPITLVPRPGGGFSQLDCIVEFNPDGEPNKRPVAYQIFPQEIWQEVIHAWQGVSVGLDEKLEFKVNPTEFADKLPISSPVKAAVELKAGANAGFVLGPFDYRISRPKIISRGRNDAKVYWRLEGATEVTHEEPRLGVVLKVPKDVARVDVDAVLSVRRTFHLFTSDLKHVWDYLSERTQRFFDQNAPTGDEVSYPDITAGV